MVSGVPVRGEEGKEDEEPAARLPLAFATQQLRLQSTVVVLMGLALFLALPFVLSEGSIVFLPLVTAMLLSVLLSPLADRLLRLGLPNNLASLLALLGFITLMILAAVLIIRPALGIIEDLPRLTARIAAHFAALREELAWLDDINRRWAEIRGNEEEREVVLAAPSMIEIVAFATPGVVIETILTLLMGYFMLRSRGGMRQYLLFGRADHHASMKAARVLREVQDRVSAYIATVGMINLGVGVAVGLMAFALGMDAPVMWGGLAALLNFLPYIGPLAMAMLLSLYGLGNNDSLLLGILPAALYLALHTIEANLVTPSILGARFVMNPVLILIGLSYFSWIWGPFGALLSVPILLVLTALTQHVGSPNLVGFIFGEPLFEANVLSDEAAEEEE